MLALALAIDAALGEPDAIWKRIPHPVVLMGRLVEMLEEGLNQGDFRWLKGVVAVIVLVAATGAPALFLSIDLFGGLFEVLVAAILLAQKSLVQHVSAVAEGLKRSLEEGRAAVAQIVGRDTDDLDADGVARAAVESAAENFSDGVVAPAFWFLLLGLPGIVVYKAVNTADSMIGHKTERYRAFGWAAARLDDALNWVPARIAGAILCVAGTGRPAMEVMLRDAWLHRSPNAGWPEAAMAASLGVALAGPRAYGGTLTDDPYLNHGGRQAMDRRDITAAVRLLWRGWAVLVGVAAGLWLLAWLWSLVF
ncbi:MAG: adenosylcobinamide-phosphate synthase CbiB [Pseudomonadota bacterium]